MRDTLQVKITETLKNICALRAHVHVASYKVAKGYTCMCVGRRVRCLDASKYARICVCMRFACMHPCYYKDHCYMHENGYAFVQMLYMRTNVFHAHVQKLHTHMRVYEYIYYLRTWKLHAIFACIYSACLGLIVEACLFFFYARVSVS